MKRTRKAVLAALYSVDFVVAVLVFLALRAMAKALGYTDGSTYEIGSQQIPGWAWLLMIVVSATVGTIIVCLLYLHLRKREVEKYRKEGRV